MDRSKVNLNVYKALTFENKPRINIRKLAYYLESEFGGYWIKHKLDIVSNKKISEKELYEFTIKIRNLDDFKDLDKIMIENNDNYVYILKLKEMSLIYFLNPIKFIKEALKIFIGEIKKRYILF